MSDEELRRAEAWAVFVDEELAPAASEAIEELLKTKVKFVSNSQWRGLGAITRSGGIEAMRKLCEGKVQRNCSENKEQPSPACVFWGFLKARAASNATGEKCLRMLAERWIQVRGDSAEYEAATSKQKKVLKQEAEDQVARAWVDLFEPEYAFQEKQSKDRGEVRDEE